MLIGYQKLRGCVIRGQFIPSAHRDKSRTCLRRLQSIEGLQHETFDSRCPNFDRGSDVDAPGGNVGLGSSKSRITKTTPIKPVRFRTAVIKSQTISGSRTKLFTRVAAGYLVTRYVLAKAPVYREGFPVYGRYVSIPEERAVRLSSERVSLLDSNGNLCLTLGNSLIPRTLKDGIEKNVFELNTTVIY